VRNVPFCLADSRTGAKEVVVERFMTVVLAGWFLFFVIVIVVLSMFFFAYRRFWMAKPTPERCPDCHRPRAMLRSATMRTPANVAHAGRRGEPIGSPEIEPDGTLIPVPGHLDVFRCRYCGHREVLEHPIRIEA
jgi:hypothetical protein